MAALLTSACGGSDEGGGPGSEDTGGVDTGVVVADSTSLDSSLADTSATEDTASTDSGSADSGSVDSTPADSTLADSFAPDTFVADTLVPDTFVADTFVPDTFVADTFVPDTFVADTFVPDTSVADTGPADAFFDCNDDNPCSFDYRDHEAGVCMHTALSGVACDDGNACNGADDVCVVGECKGAQPPALRDDFNSGILDPTRWVKDESFGKVTPASGGVRFANRGFLSTVEEFDPSKGAVRITLVAKHEAADDILRVVVRSDGKMQGTYHELNNGVACSLGYTGQVQLFQMVNGAYKMLALNATDLPIPYGEPVILEVFDDGTNVTCTARMQTSKQRRTLTAAAPKFAKNLVSIYNREYPGYDRRSFIDNVTIERGVSVRPSSQWQFEEPAGATLIDWAADADGVLGADGTRTPGVSGTNVTSSGSATGTADFGATLGALATSDFTITFWTKGARPAAPLDFLGNRDSSSGGQYFGTRATTAGKLLVEMYGDPTAAGGSLTVTAPVFDSLWHHVALQRKGTTLAAWVDGAASGTSTVAGVPNVSSTKSLMFGRSPFTGMFENFFAASLDDLRLYKAPLTECEVKNVYGR